MRGQSLKGRTSGEGGSPNPSARPSPEGEREGRSTATRSAPTGPTVSDVARCGVASASEASGSWGWRGC